MIFISGVYYPMENLPDGLRLFATILPLASAVELVRPLVIGQIPDMLLVKLLHLIAFAIGAFYLSLVLTRRRFEKG
jgi:lipooligosaccharide transport system permease protein